MEVIFEILFEIVFEVLIEIVAQILFELGFESLASSFREERQLNPLAAILLYIVFGALLGGLSLFIFPEPIIKSAGLKTLHLIISPILVGLSLCFVSWIWKRRARGEEIFNFQKFTLGCVFALAYAVTRIVFTY